MAFTAQDVKKLREMTNVGMMDCKKALQATDGDMDKAVDWLREKGLAKAAKKADRVAAEGVAFATVVDGVGVVIEVNSETDFAAKTDAFLDLVKNPRKVDGVSMLPTLEKNVPMPQRKLYSAETGFMTVTDGDWKCVWGKNDKMELFNLMTDRNEEHDLSAMYPERVEGYKKDMQNWWNDCTKGTRLEGRTTWNSGWFVELIEKLAKEGKTLQDLPFFQQAAGKGVMNPVKKNAKKNAKKKAKK